MDRKKIFWAIFAVVLAVLSVWAVIGQSKDFSPSKMMEVLRTAHIGWMLAAICSMFGFIFFEGLAIRILIKRLDRDRKRLRFTLYAAADVYFSAITPSASGGQPASAFFMMKDGITAATSAVILLVNLIMYTLAVMSIGIFCIFLRPDVLLGFGIPSKVFIGAGYVIMLFATLIFILLLVREKLLHRICEFLLRMVDRLRLIRHPEKIRRKLKKSMEEYDKVSGVIAHHRDMLFLAFVFNLLQRMSQIFVTAFVYMGMGGSAEKFIDVWCVQSFTAIGSNCAPIPGAMGVADYLLLDGLSGIVDPSFVTNLELISRGISFYSCVLLSLLIVGIGYFTLVLERRKVRKRQIQEGGRKKAESADGQKPAGGVQE